MTKQHMKVTGKFGHMFLLLMFVCVFVLFYSDFNSLKKEDVYENNKLVGRVLFMSVFL